MVDIQETPYAAVSNCGVTELKSQYGDFKLENILPYVTIHNEFNNNHSILVLCHTFNERLQLNIQYPHPAVKLEDVYVIAEAFKQNVLQAEHKANLLTADGVRRVLKV